MTKIAVVGSRDFDDYTLFESVMDDFLRDKGQVLFVSGGANGADKLAEEYAKVHDIEIIIYKAEWKRYGRGAGFVRNKKIWDESDMGIAFWDGKSKGTQHSFKLAEKMGKALVIYNYKDQAFIEIVMPYKIEDMCC